MSEKAYKNKGIDVILLKNKPFLAFCSHDALIYPQFMKGASVAVFIPVLQKRNLTLSGFRQRFSQYELKCRGQKDFSGTR